MLHNPNEELLFPTLSEEELQRLSEHGHELQMNAGDILFSEGDPTYHFYVVLEGEVRVTKRVGGEEQVLTVHQRGQFTGEISMLTGDPALATGRSIGSSRVLAIEPDAFKRVLSECSQGASVILTAMVGRAREVEVQLRQQEKLAALGKLSAGLSHELNNPAAAGRRAAQQLRDALQNVQLRTLNLCDQQFSKTQRQLLAQLQLSAIAHSVNTPPLDPLTQSDREDALTDWLEQQGFANAWKLAPTLVSAGVDEQRLSEIAPTMSAQALEEALCWLEATLNVAGLVNAIEQSTARISELVKAVKAYSYMDQAPLQEIDLHEGLENTLAILNHKLKHGIKVTREYDRSLPRICAYASELNQVWTNLIDNAIYAMNGKGELTIRTARKYDTVLVEIVDNGAGIPPAIQTRIFEPFFTTKGVGEGTGLGLDTTRRIVLQKHHGDIRFNSQPGNTCFQVCLPIKPPKQGQGDKETGDQGNPLSEGM